MKKFIIGLSAFISMSVWAAVAETPQHPATNGTFLSIEKSPPANTIETKLDNVEKLLGDFQNQLDTNTKAIDSFKPKFEIFELVKAYNQSKQQYAELEQRYTAQVQRSDTLSKQLIQHQALMDGVNSSIAELKTSLAGADEKIVSLNEQIAKGEATVAALNTELGLKLQETNTTTNAMVNKVADDASSKFVMIAFGFGIAVLFIGGFILILRRRIDASGEHMEQKIQSAKASLEENALSLDLKLVEVLEKQMQLSQEQKTVAVTEQQDAEPDHSLSLKVADEITRMQKNISQMDPSVKGIKPLTKGLERIRKNFMANGYEIIDLLNKPYDDRMNIDVINYIDDTALGEDEKIIVKVIRPQVNFNGVLIQRAQVDVAVN